MFEAKTSQAILFDMLNRVDPSLDTREGSIIYDALAPVAVEFAQIYVALDNVLNETFVDTASLKNLKKRAAERGIAYFDARQAIIAAQIDLADGDELQPGSRFFIDGIGFVFEGAVSDDGAEYLLVCETAGSVGNIGSGSLVFDGQGITVKSAKIIDIVTAGRDAESEDELRARYYENLDNAPFGGNKAAYREKILEIEGVGGCKVDRPTDIADGNNVYITVMDANYGAIENDTMLQSIRDSIDPPVSGDGEGFAPICHKVVVRSVRTETVHVSVGVQVQEGYSSEPVLNNLKAAAETYASAVRRQWAEKGEGVLKKSELFVALLGSEGVADLLSLSLTDDEGAEQAVIRYDGDVIPVVEVALLG